MNKLKSFYYAVAAFLLGTLPMLAVGPEDDVIAELTTAQTSATNVISAAGAVLIALALLGALYLMGARWIRRAVGRLP